MKIYISQDNLWNFLFFTGYLKIVDKKFKSDKSYLSLKIPSREIHSIYIDKVTKWFDNKIKNENFQGFVTAFKDRTVTKYLV